MTTANYRRSTGGAFRALAGRLGALELRDVRRQREPWDRQALAQLRDGDLGQWIDSYQRHGRINAAPTADQLRDRLVDDWWRATERTPNAQMVMVALRRRDVRDLNDRARNRIRAAGRLGRDDLHIGQRAFATGDQVIAVRNDRRIGIANGARATVTSVDPTTRCVRVAIDGQDLELPAQYLDNEGLDHAYAMTAHRLQGATVDRTFVLGSDELYREWGYTALSRHRDSAHYYTIADRAQPSLPGLENQDPLRGELLSDLSRRRGKDLASSIPDHGEQDESRCQDDRRLKLLRTIPAAVQHMRRQQAALEVAEEERSEAIARLQQTEADLVTTGRLRRKTRDGLQRRHRSQQAAVDHWAEEIAQLHNLLNDATVLRREWLAEHGWEMRAILGRDGRDIPTANPSGTTPDRGASDELLLDRLLDDRVVDGTARTPDPFRTRALGPSEPPEIAPPEY